MATDDFNRADGPGLGPNWTVNQGALRIRLNTRACGGIGTISVNAAVWTADTFGADHYSQATVVSLSVNGPYVGVTVRSATGATTFYHLQTSHLSSGAWKLVRNVAGTGTDLATGMGLAVGDVMRLEVEGTGATVTLRAYAGAALLTTYADTHADRLLTGQPGIFIYSEYDDNMLDDWSGGDLVVPPTPSDPGTPPGAFFVGRMGRGR